MLRERRAVTAIKRYIEILKLVDGSKSISEIARKLGMRVATVSDYLKDLAELGLVHVRVVEGAPKRFVPELTEKGKCFLKCFEELTK